MIHRNASDTGGSPLPEKQNIVKRINIMLAKFVCVWKTWLWAKIQSVSACFHPPRTVENRSAICRCQMCPSLVCCCVKILVMNILLTKFKIHNPGQLIRPLIHPKHVYSERSPAEFSRSCSLKYSGLQTDRSIFFMHSVKEYRYLCCVFRQYWML